MFLLVSYLASAAQLPPTVILLSLDTVAADNLSSYGYTRETTPFIDSFGRENVLFENAYSQAGHTLASHFSTFTGTYPQNHHMLSVKGEGRENKELPNEILTLAEYLKANGYKTYWSGDLDDPNLPLDRGLKRGFDEMRHSAIPSWGIMDVAYVRSILESVKRQPSFLFLHTYYAHSPYKSSAAYEKIFAGGNARVPLQSYSDLTSDYYKTLLKLGSIESARVELRDRYRRQFIKRGPDEAKLLRALYDGGLRELDYNVSSLFSLIKEAGLYDNSIIILTSDHGESFGEHRSYEHGRTYENNLHVPLIMKLPGQGPKRVKDLALNIDILPTILEALQIPSKSKIEGRNLLPLLEGKPVAQVGYSYAFGGNYAEASEAVFDYPWKLILDGYKVAKGKMLFRMDLDPGETNDLADLHPGEVLRLETALSAYKAAHSLKNSPVNVSRRAPAEKLYWFIPDGARADPQIFDVFKWAREGKLPNLQRMLQQGSYGYSIPDFPSHTPINFASLMTGAHPSTHGIADGPMHGAGAPLEKPSISGFSSTAKKVPPVWKIMESLGKRNFLLSVPGSTPPEILETTVRGRWGGWGADTYNMVFESNGLLKKRKESGRAFRLFFLGAPLTKFVETEKNKDGSLEARLDAHGSSILTQVLAQTPGGEKQLDLLRFTLGEKTIFLKEGDWSGWLPLEMEFKGLKFLSHARIKVIKIWPNGNFRVRVLYDNLNPFITEPGQAAQLLQIGLGPMVDHADNWPPQLVFEREDKDTFLDEMRFSLDWHRRAVPFVIEKFKPDVFIHDTYTPNQMLESRWWMRNVDKTSKTYSKDRADKTWPDILEMYQGLDSILGEALKKSDGKTLIAFSSDHGVCPLHRLVHLNNLFAKKGWLKFVSDPLTGESKVDWKNTKVVYLKMLHVYVNPDSLEGNWSRGSGPRYKKLVQEVKEAIEGLRDRDGNAPLVRAISWENVEEVYSLPRDRVGDLVLEARPSYYWYEEVDPSLRLFSDPLTSGYKQAIDPKKNKCMWTPFVLWGPGVKPGHFIDQPVSHVDQLPTILKLMNLPAPKHVQGRVLTEAIE